MNLAEMLLNERYKKERKKAINLNKNKFGA